MDVYEGGGGWASCGGQYRLNHPGAPELRPRRRVPAGANGPIFDDVFVTAFFNGEFRGLSVEAAKFWAAWFQIGLCFDVPVPKDFKSIKMSLFSAIGAGLPGTVCSILTMRRPAWLTKPNFLRGGFGYVDDAVAVEGAAVVDADVVALPFWYWLRAHT